MFSVGVSTTSNKGQRWCPVISIFHSLFVVPLLDPTLKNLQMTKISYDMQI
ncbi:predicted protein [Arabidopsis lyrata subsp. lyrata]|uniref:Predicted protein n=1 Tax=Arabidopsis lyrata subsp. lyrata TaxID=81972 RepID=D7KMV5_ARALL|nr:predicted protein [Arabidopsis lyrata subsp. lyrata]